jgi:mannose-6-phosphate isomerase-like protein (cupin superfamily)
MRLVDLAVELRALALREALISTFDVADHALTLVRIPAGHDFRSDSLDPGHEPGPASTLLVLDGVGTIAIEGSRATVAAGHLLEVTPRTQFTATADGGVALALLWTRAPRAAMPPATENERATE